MATLESVKEMSKESINSMKSTMETASPATPSSSRISLACTLVEDVSTGIAEITIDSSETTRATAEYSTSPALEISPMSTPTPDVSEEAIETNSNPSTSSRASTTSTISTISTISITSTSSSDSDSDDDFPSDANLRFNLRPSLYDLQMGKALQAILHAMPHDSDNIRFFSGSHPKPSKSETFPQAWTEAIERLREHGEIDPIMDERECVDMVRMNAKYILYTARYNLQEKLLDLDRPGLCETPPMLQCELTRKYGRLRACLIKRETDVAEHEQLTARAKLSTASQQNRSNAAQKRERKTRAARKSAGPSEKKHKSEGKDQSGKQGSQGRWLRKRLNKLLPSTDAEASNTSPPQHSGKGKDKAVSAEEVPDYYDTPSRFNSCTSSPNNTKTVTNTKSKTATKEEKPDYYDTPKRFRTS